MTPSEAHDAGRAAAVASVHALEPNYLDDEQTEIIRDGLSEIIREARTAAGKFLNIAERLRAGESIVPWSDGEIGARNAERFAAKQSARAARAIELRAWMMSGPYTLGFKMRRNEW